MVSDQIGSDKAKERQSEGVGGCDEEVATLSSPFPFPVYSFPFRPTHNTTQKPTEVMNEVTK